jgi:hypothetical protein
VAAECRQSLRGLPVTAVGFGDVTVTEELVQSLSNAHALGAVVFQHCPVGEHPIARRKYLETQMAEDWGD